MEEVLEQVRRKISFPVLKTGNKQLQGMSYYEADSGDTELLQECGSFRVLFLLKGDMHLYGRQYGEHSIQEMQSILLPPFEETHCTFFEKSTYIIATCDRLKTAGNSAYFNQLAQASSKPVAEYTLLPVSINLANILRGMFFYSSESFQYYCISDALLVVLRALYTDKELTAFFYPVIHIRKRTEGMQPKKTAI